RRPARATAVDPDHAYHRQALPAERVAENLRKQSSGRSPCTTDPQPASRRWNSDSYVTSWRWSRKRSSTRPANRELIVQSGLSNSIHALERELGTLLYIRGTRPFDSPRPARRWWAQPAGR